MSNIERRSFIKGLAGLIGGIALNEAIPLGRVWSFPKQIKPLNIERGIAIRYIRAYDLFHDQMLCRIDTLDLELPVGVHTALSIKPSETATRIDMANLIDKYIPFVPPDIRSAASRIGAGEVIQWRELYGADQSPTIIRA